jgi:beta-galactosidase
MREKLLMDRGWRFALGHAANPAMDFEFVRSRCLVKAGEARGAASVKFDDSKWRAIDLPHDWAVELPFDPKGDKEVCEHGFYAIGPDHPEHSVGWYRKQFTIPKRDLGKRLSIEFDAVFRDCVVWLNGHRLGRHQSGYTSFRFDITDLANYGGENVLVVRADASSWEGWWYEGAGIYRHVWLVKTDPVHIGHWGTFVTSEVKRDKALVSIRTTVVNESDDPVKVKLLSTFSREAKRIATLATTTTPISLKPWETKEVEQQVTLKSPKLWSPDEPNLYVVASTVVSGQKQLDRYTTTFGIRTLRWDAKKGFFLNGKSFKIKGTCNHRDHAGVGVALPDRLHELRIEKLKEFGCNAFRASHYPHAPELLDACDRLGLLVMAENRLAGSSEEVLGQLESLIRRDRNHPSIILWSLANEEHTVQWSMAGERIGKTMVRRAHQLDPTRKVTAAMHDRGLNEGFANIVDVHGWNYIKVGDIEAFHKRRPEQPIVGSEEASTVCTRGEYADDAAKGYVSAYDLRAPKWGSTAEDWWKFFAERDWLAGGFVWTGFDHRGEPIPYKWPCTLSHFGIMDLCGFPKDNYYYYKSWWTNEPMLYLFPHWNWAGKTGRPIDVRVFSNLDEIELTLNGRSLGRKAVPKLSHVAWQVMYEPGEIEAIGYQSGREVLRSRRVTTGEPVGIQLIADRPMLWADGEDVASATVAILDAQGNVVPTANRLVTFEISGDGRLIGVGNGDPSSHESEKASHRMTFNGLALALVQASPDAGEIVIRATSEGLQDAKLLIPTKRCRPRPSV